MKKEKGITLIALVIIIIILLILAGVIIINLTGENGILAKTESAEIRNTESSIKEQIEIAVMSSKVNYDIKIDLNELEKGLLQIEGVTNDSIEKEGIDNNLPWTVVVKEMKFKIDEEGKVIRTILLPKKMELLKGSSEKITAKLLLGLQGTITWTIEDENIATLSSTTGESVTITGVENGTTTITVIINRGGSISQENCELTIVDKSEPINVENMQIEQTKSKELQITKQPNENVEELVYISSDENIATVDQNGKVTGITVGTTTIVITGKLSKEEVGRCTVTVTEHKTSILEKVGEIETSGIHTIKANGMTYNLHVYCYDEDQNWTTNQVFGDAGDVGTASGDASKMVVVKVNGNLNIASGVNVGPYHSNYGGPKGFLLYCTGTLTNNGTIQNNYGAKASGENVFLWANSNGSYEYVPAQGAFRDLVGVVYNGRAAYPGPEGLNASTSQSRSGSGAIRATAQGGAGGTAACNRW